jgi:hypothetical protein
MSTGHSPWKCGQSCGHFGLAGERADSPTGVQGAGTYRNRASGVDGELEER